MAIKLSYKKWVGWLFKCRQIKRQTNLKRRVAYGNMTMRFSADTTSSGNINILRDGLLLNLLNPKLSLFFLVFLPQFVSANKPDTMIEMTLLGLIFMAMTFAVLVMYGCVAGALRSQIIERPKVMSVIGKSFAGAFVLMGAKLVFASR